MSKYENIHNFDCDKYGKLIKWTYVLADVKEIGRYPHAGMSCPNHVVRMQHIHSFVGNTDQHFSAVELHSSYFLNPHSVMI